MEFSMIKVGRRYYVESGKYAKIGVVADVGIVDFELTNVTVYPRVSPKIAEFRANGPAQYAIDNSSEFPPDVRCVIQRSTVEECYEWPMGWPTSDDEERREREEKGKKKKKKKS